MTKAEKTKIQYCYQNVQVDLYFATQENWIPLLICRTGSAEHNVEICRKALSLGLQIFFGKEGKFGIFTKQGSKLKTDSEEEFFNRLGMPYVPPEERD